MIHRTLSIANEHAWIVSVVREDDDANARSRRKFVAIDWERSGKYPRKFIYQAFDRAFTHDLAKQHDEFITTIAACERVVGERRLQPLCKRA